MPSKRSPRRWRRSAEMSSTDPRHPRPEPPPASGAQPGLIRRLGVTDAVVIGLGSMVGAGCSRSGSRPLEAAGSGLLIGLALAAVVAYCNAVVLGAARRGLPRLGRDVRVRARAAGGVVGVRRRLVLRGREDGVVCRDGADVRDLRRTGHRMAATVLALAAVVALAAVNYRGVTRTARLTGILVACTLAVLALVLVLPRSPASRIRAPAVARRHFAVRRSAGSRTVVLRVRRVRADRDDGRGGPRPGADHPARDRLAVVIAIGIYLGGGGRAVASPRPGVDRSAPRRRGRHRRRGLGVPDRAGRSALASLGALLALIAGIGRTALAMARNHDLPAGWPPYIRGSRSRTTPRSRSPWSSASWCSPPICVA